MNAAFVWADGECVGFDDVQTAITEALERAELDPHVRVGVDVDPDGARRAAARALPGMVVCTRRAEFEHVECFPLTTRVAMVCSRPRTIRTASGTPGFAVLRFPT